jgi:membrane protease subunit HflK
MGTAHQLSSNEEGIVTTFGKYTSTIGPGMNLTAPWPIQRVRVEDVTRSAAIRCPMARRKT